MKMLSFLCRADFLKRTIAPMVLLTGRQRSLADSMWVQDYRQNKTFALTSWADHVPRSSMVIIQGGKSVDLVRTMVKNPGGRYWNVNQLDEDTFIMRDGNMTLTILSPPLRGGHWIYVDPSILNQL